MGAHWLPLVSSYLSPICVFRFTVQIGTPASLISVLSFALSGWLTFRINRKITGSLASGVFASAVLLLNPNLHYLQSCPLTEPVYMLLLLLALDSFISWRDSDHTRQPWLSAVWVTLGLFAGTKAGISCRTARAPGLRFWTGYVPRRKAIQGAAVFAGMFAVPAAAHFGYIYFRLGDNFFRRVAEGNPDPYLTYKRPILSVIYHLGSCRRCRQFSLFLRPRPGCCWY